MIAERQVDIRFECLPFRSIGRMDIPLDASPRFRAKCERIKASLAKHGSLNTYYLHDGVCRFQLSNHPGKGLLYFVFEGMISTDEWDEKSVSSDLQIDLKLETCVGLTQPVVAWFQENVARAVMLEFERYIAAGDLNRTKERLAFAETQWEQCGGFVGMGL
ncbi:MAG: hypothetical protein K8U03_12215 [Planctomycetia bacterium]|nr:hypothetical protein [Planctomycetia bacterium]